MAARASSLPFCFFELSPAAWSPRAASWVVKRSSM